MELGERCELLQSGKSSITLVGTGDWTNLPGRADQHLGLPRQCLQDAGFQVFILKHHVLARPSATIRLRPHCLQAAVAAACCRLPVAGNLPLRPRTLRHYIVWACNQRVENRKRNRAISLLGYINIAAPQAARLRAAIGGCRHDRGAELSAGDGCVLEIRAAELRALEIHRKALAAGRRLHDGAAEVRRLQIAELPPRNSPIAALPIGSWHSAWWHCRTGSHSASFCRRLRRSACLRRRSTMLIARLLGWR